MATVPDIDWVEIIRDLQPQLLDQISDAMFKTITFNDFVEFSFYKNESEALKHFREALYNLHGTVKLNLISEEAEFLAEVRA